MYVCSEYSQENGNKNFYMTCRDIQIKEKKTKTQ